MRFAAWTLSQYTMLIEIRNVKLGTAAGFLRVYKSNIFCMLIKCFTVQWSILPIVLIKQSYFPDTFVIGIVISLIKSSERAVIITVHVRGTVVSVSPVVLTVFEPIRLSQIEVYTSIRLVCSLFVPVLGD